ncbi:MAG: efflux RND transporter periplasmic adaptor subunit [Thiobacillus sp.]|uniref:HlyD family secretion protein n=1 Tax=Thiobacillus sp. TaxID=924 RepID=UPI002894B340|nr:efflux RND transporter periplasmic adaptor subunit [Thiobacillus sp.]MDT3706229.1 efflux RND transporter periplasmic adaptor subunit [Thiobacillus sp.]
MRKTWLWTLLGIVALAAISYAVFLWLSPPALPEGILYGNGRIEATEVTVSAEVGGRVLESALVEGRTVQANDLLVRLDEIDLKTRLRQAEANAAAAQRAQVQVERQMVTARHHVQTADDELARYRKLRETGNVSLQMLDRVENQQREARGQVETLAAQRSQSAASREAALREVELLRSQAGKAVIRAPSAGTILSKGIEAGELATPGRTIAVLADLARIELKVYVPESEIGKIKLNDPARVRVDAFPERYFEARVARVEQRAQFTPKDVHMPDERARLVFGVVLAVDNPEGYLKPGMPADAWVRWKPEAAWPDKLTVPR